MFFFSYQNSPDLRLTWLQHMAEKHTSVSVLDVKLTLLVFSKSLLTV